ncbi:MAG: hypothetical protein ACRELY_22975 [Polyangiaceae bacterium]
MRTLHFFGLILFFSFFAICRDARADIPPECEDPGADPGTEVLDEPIGDGGVQDIDAGFDAGVDPPYRPGKAAPCASRCSISRVGVDASIGGLMMMIGAASLLVSRRRRPS